MEEAVTRLQLAAAAGADVCFIEGVKTEELLRSTVAALAPKPVSISTLPLLTCILTQALTASGSRQCHIWGTDAIFYYI